jgi:hypothetical protein
MKRAWVRITGIGIFHALLYLVLVPFIIVPCFGVWGLEVTIAGSVIISVVVMGSLGVRKKNKKLKGECGNGK